MLQAATSIVPSVQKISAVAAAGSKDLDATALLLTTQEQVAQTVAVVANYGGSLDVIVDDAEVTDVMTVLAIGAGTGMIVAVL